MSYIRISELKNYLLLNLTPGSTPTITTLVEGESSSEVPNLRKIKMMIETVINLIRGVNKEFKLNLIPPSVESVFVLSLPICSLSKKGCIVGIIIPSFKAFTRSTILLPIRTPRATPITLKSTIIFSIVLVPSATTFNGLAIFFNDFGIIDIYIIHKDIKLPGKM